MENSLFHKIPGYPLLKSLSHRLAGQERDSAWKPALAEIEEALVPAFIVEELDDGRFTVFVPSCANTVCGIGVHTNAERGHVLEVGFAQAITAVSKWGSGSKELVAAMRSKEGLNRPQPELGNVAIRTATGRRF